MNTSQDLSIISLVLNASVLAQAVMGLLLLLSLMSWTFIFRKWFAIRRARAQTERFEKDFWSGGDLQALYQAQPTTATRSARSSGSSNRACANS